MKFFAVLIILGLSFVASTKAQHPVLFGTTTSGNGGIFQFESKDKEIKNLYRFKNSGVFRSSMIRATNGIIYGVADGGPFGYGIIYSVDPVTLKYTILKSFREIDGAGPNSLVEGKDGKLYGITSSGNSGNSNSYPEGVLFSFDPASSVFEVLLYFGDVFVFDAKHLALGSDGVLYGTGHSMTDNLVYSYNSVTRKFQIESSFHDEQFREFKGAMIEGTDGLLYGLNEKGGAHNGGVLFSYSLKSKKVLNLVDFNSETGMNPQGSLIRGSDGNLYSITSQGTIFRFDPKKNSIKAIHKIDNIIEGGTYGGLAEGLDGKLYGMTLKAPLNYNSDSSGSIFYSIDKDGTDFKIIRSFDHTNKYALDGNLILVNDKVFGVASSEKLNPDSYIFSYEPGTDLFVKVIQTNLDKGIVPIGDLLTAKDGRLYGMVSYGAGFGSGGIYSFNPATRLYTMLVPFNKDRGIVSVEWRPFGGLAQAANGKIYGLTKAGGANNNGVIFSFDPEKNAYLVIKSFKTGSSPINPFVTGDDGKLYSTLRRDRKIGDNFEVEYILFSFNPTNRKYEEHKTLCCYDPGSFTKGSDGKLYATGNLGIYIYDPVSNALDHITYPWENFTTPGRLVEGVDHQLYGMADNGRPILYSFNRSSHAFTALFEFDDDVEIYHTSLFSASDGLLYGTIRIGGMKNLGTLFSFDPLSSSFKPLDHFDEFTGGLPQAGQLVELNTSSAPIVSITDTKLYENAGMAKLTVSLNRISLENVLLNYRTVPGTASDDPLHPDYVSATGQVIIPAGELSTTISVRILEDELIENREVLTLVLQQEHKAFVQMGDSVGRISIWNGQRPLSPPGGEVITISPVAQNHIAQMVTNELLTRASPNPSSSFFTLHIGGNNSDRVSVTVTNLWGQVMDKFYGALKSSPLTFGQNYQSGSYFARIVDGSKTKVIKLVKISK